jgi:hypothetical protein
MTHLNINLPGSRSREPDRQFGLGATKIEHLRDMARNRDEIPLSTSGSVSFSIGQMSQILVQSEVYKCLYN